MKEFANATSRDARDFHLTGTAAVADIERQLRSYYRVRYALAVSNATDGLRALALAIGLRNAEFVTTPLTWGGSIGEWLRLGDRPRFAPVQPRTLTIDPKAVAGTITPQTRAILAVDIFGNPADMAALRAIADERGIWYIGDASQSMGALREGLAASSLADAWVVSFGSGKGVDAGDGGAILTNHRDLYEKLIWETQHPTRHRIVLGLDHDNEFAANCRMNPWSAIFLAETFDAQVRCIAMRQAWITRALRDPRVAALVESVASEASTAASYQRIVVSWRGRAAPADLLKALENCGADGEIEPLCARPLYRQPAFLLNYRKRATGVLVDKSLGVDLSKYVALRLELPEEPR